MRKPLVAIFGCGPSGLLAAHACEMYDVPYVVFSRVAKSRLGGAQFSHIPIPGIHDPEYPETTLTYEVRGDPETYHQKVYGDLPVPFVSMSNVKDGDKVPAWNLRGLYDRLWEMYSERVVSLDITPEIVDKFRQGPFDLIFSSVPLPALCWGGWTGDNRHHFRSQPVQIINEALIPSLEDNTIIYNGTEEHAWYRMSKLFGVGSTEWGAGSPTPPIKNLKTVNKPISTNCDCHLPSVIRIGRFGTWAKGELTFHAFNRILDELAKKGMEI